MNHGPVIPDEQFIRGNVPMTKQEIRLFLMASAMIAAEDTVWDIGAGTGSLSIESARRAQRGHVYAMDGNEEACELVRQNAAKFSLDNLTILAEKAPAALAMLPDPDVVFVGGSGGELAAILSESATRLRPGGRMIIMAVLVETLQDTLRFCAGLKDFQTEACGLQVTRIEPVAKRHMFRALNPIYAVVCRKGGIL